MLQRRDHQARAGVMLVLLEGSAEVLRDGVGVSGTACDVMGEGDRWDLAQESSVEGETWEIARVRAKTKKWFECAGSFAARG